MTFPTLFSNYTAIEKSLRQIDNTPSEVSLSPLDMFLICQIINMYPEPPLVLDLAFAPTNGRSAAMWATDETRNTWVLPLRASWQPNTPSINNDLFNQPADSDAIRSAVEEKRTSGTPVIMILAHLPTDELYTHLVDLCRLYQPNLLFLLPVGQFGKSDSFHALMLLQKERYEVRLLRELAPFTAQSEIAVIYKQESTVITHILQRCADLVRGNFDYLNLVAENTNLYFRVEYLTNLLRSQASVTPAPPIQDVPRRYKKLRSIYHLLVPLQLRLRLRDARYFLKASLQRRKAPQLEMRDIDRGSQVSQPSPLTLDGVNYVADLKANIGLSHSARLIYHTLQQEGISLTYTEIPMLYSSRTYPISIDVPGGSPYSFTIAHINPGEYSYMLEHAPKELFSNNHYKIAIWYWETPDFPKEWYRLFKFIDEVWVTSRYMQSIIARVAPIPVVYIPLPVFVQQMAEDEVVDDTFALPDDRFIFLFTFDAASSIGRKNPFGVIEAFKRAFGAPTSGPLLVLKSHGWSYANANRAKDDLCEALKSVNGLFISDLMSPQALVKLFKACDCYVTLHRSEGFGLGLAEAMALGKPTIATAYSGNMDFMNDHHSYGVRYTLRPISPEDHHYQPHFNEIYKPGQWWAEPDLTHAAQLMRQVYENPEESQEKGKRARLFIERWHTPAVTGRHIQQRLERLVEYAQQ
jgi:glycosyltransferase involved in cell wall biosynthesis